MPRDGQLLVGGNDPRGNTTGRGADVRTARIVRLTVQVDAEPDGLPANRRAHRHYPLADCFAIDTNAAISASAEIAADFAQSILNAEADTICSYRNIQARRDLAQRLPESRVERVVHATPRITDSR